MGQHNADQTVRSHTGEWDKQGLNTQARWRWLDNRERDTGGHNEGGTSNHTEGNNQDQGRQSQGDRW